MACSGLHCSGCAGGSAAPVVVLAAAYGVEWVVTHMVEVIAVSAACGALAVAAVAALMRWGARREARHAAERPFLMVREVPSAFHPPFHLSVSPDPARGEMQQAGETAVTISAAALRIPGTSAERRELPAGGIHLHFHGLPGTEQAAAIRQALNRNQAGDD